MQIFRAPNVHLILSRKKEQETAPAPTWATEIFKTINLSKTVIDFTVHEAAEALDSSHSLP